MAHQLVLMSQPHATCATHEAPRGPTAPTILANASALTVHLDTPYFSGGLAARTVYLCVVQGSVCCYFALLAGWPLASKCARSPTHRACYAQTPERWDCIEPESEQHKQLISSAA